MSCLITLIVFVSRFCSGETAGEDEPIQTFVIPHSHMDVGWVYTVQVGVFMLQPFSRVCAVLFDLSVCVRVCPAGEYARLRSQRVQQCDRGAVKDEGAQVSFCGAGVFQTVVGLGGIRYSEKTSMAANTSSHMTNNL